VLIPEGLDLATATDEEIIDAYVEIGLQEGYGRVVIDLIRAPEPGRERDDQVGDAG
jgi:hypothetical protein